MELYLIEPNQTHRLDATEALAVHSADPKAKGFFVLVCMHEESRDWIGTAAHLGHIVPLDEHLRDAAALHHPSYFESARD